jgi:hypothetical protein
VQIALSALSLPAVVTRKSDAPIGETARGY